MLSVLFLASSSLSNCTKFAFSLCSLTTFVESKNDFVTFKIELKHEDTYIGVCTHVQLLSFGPSLEKGWKEVEHLCTGYKYSFQFSLPCLLGGGEL